MQCHVAHEKNILILMFIAFKISCILPTRKVIPSSSSFFVKSHVYFLVNLRLLFWSNLISILCQTPYSFAVKSQVFFFCQFLWLFAVISRVHFPSTLKIILYQNLIFICCQISCLFLMKNVVLKSHTHLMSNLKFILYQFSCIFVVKSQVHFFVKS